MLPELFNACHKLELGTLYATVIVIVGNLNSAMLPVAAKTGLTKV